MSYGLVPRMGQGGSFLSKSREYSSNAINAMSGMQPGSKTETTPPGKTAGGALSAGMGGAIAGASLASVTGATAATAGALGLGLGALTGIGAGVMGLAYFLS